MISILPCWKETLDKTPPPATPSFVGPLSRLPKKTSVYSECLTFVNTSEGVRDLIQLAHERPISWIGFDTEYRFDRPAVTIKKDVEAVDVRSVHPLLLSLSLVEPESDDQLRIYRFVVDVRQPELAQKLESIFRLPVPFVAHFARAELHCLWQLQLAELTARVMCEAVQALFPQLRPRCEINISHPECWNKDGMASALRDWCENAMRTAEVATNN